MEKETSERRKRNRETERKGEMKGMDRKRERQSAEYVAVCTCVCLCSSTFLEGPWKRLKRAAIKMTRERPGVPTTDAADADADADATEALLLFPRSLPATHIRSPRSAPGAA